MNIEPWQIRVLGYCVIGPLVVLVIYRKPLIAEWKERRGKPPTRVHVSRANMKTRRIRAEIARDEAARRAVQARLNLVPYPIRSRLYNMVGGDQKAAMRLVDYERNCKPGESEPYYWQAAIESLLNDRRSF